MGDPMLPLYAVGAALLFLLAMYLTGAVAATVRIRRDHWMSADPRFESWEDDDPPAEAERYVADLRKVGFAVRGQWRHLGPVKAVGILTLLEHPQTLDVAKVLVVSAGTRRQVTLLFQTRFADGTEVATANNKATSGFPPLPEITVLWLSEVRETHRLYYYHEQLRDHLGAGKKRKPVGPDPVAFLVEGTRRILGHAAEAGFYTLDPAANVYRPTRKGAVLMTWRRVWPFRSLAMARRRRRTERLVRELGIRENGAAA
jgi:hypothetical protein